MIDDLVYQKEINMCHELYQKSGGCNWGRCENCGVLPLLHKLHSKEILEDLVEIKKFKNKILQ